MRLWRECRALHRANHLADAKPGRYVQSDYVIRRALRNLKVNLWKRLLKRGLDPAQIIADAQVGQPAQDDDRRGPPELFEPRVD